MSHDFYFLDDRGQLRYRPGDAAIFNNCGLAQLALDTYNCAFENWTRENAEAICAGDFVVNRPRLSVCLADTYERVVVNFQYGTHSDAASASSASWEVDYSRATHQPPPQVLSARRYITPPPPPRYS